MAQVSFICKRTVVSTKPVQPGKFTSLSVLDHVMEHSNIRLVLYYNTPARRAPGELTRQLIESISEMLFAYPPVTGRLVKTPEGHWMVKCNDAGVRLVEARVKGSIDEWLQTVNREKELELVHWEDMYHKSYFWSTFYVQITEFETGGVAIGLSCTHLMSDLVCASMILKAWADMTRCRKIGSPPSFHPLPSARQGSENYSHSLISHYKAAMESSGQASNTKKATVTFQFNQEKVRSYISSMTDGECNPFEALAALFWIRISMVKGTPHALVNMSICMDARVALGLDEGFFGNCMVYSNVRGDGVDEHKLADAVMMVKEAVSAVDRDGVMGLIEWLEKEGCKSAWMHASNLICVNLERVQLSVLEGLGRAVHMSCYIEAGGGPGQVVILPGEGEYGRVVAVTLPEDEAEKLLKDDVIERFDPLVLMGFNKVC